jgi:hypothetical protein
VIRAAVVLAACMVGLGPASARAEPPSPGAQHGVYEECAPSHRGCLARLDQIARGGFKVVLNYTQWSGSTRQIRRYARRAAADGLELIWPLNAPAWRGRGHLRATYPELRHECRCATDRGLLRFAVRLARSESATWGYYVGDQLDPGERARIRTLAKRVRALDDARPLLLVAFGGDCVVRRIGAFAPFVDVLGVDSYPYGQGGDAAQVGDDAAALSRVAADSGRRSAMVLQSFSFHQYFPSRRPRWPTREEMRRMRDLALAHNPGLVLWYSYYDVKRADRPGKRWRRLIDAAFG